MPKYFGFDWRIWHYRYCGLAWFLWCTTIPAANFFGLGRPRYFMIRVLGVEARWYETY